jgi:hypothetical protein
MTQYRRSVHAYCFVYFWSYDHQEATTPPRTSIWRANHNPSLFPATANTPSTFTIALLDGGLQKKALKHSTIMDKQLID